MADEAESKNRLIEILEETEYIEPEFFKNYLAPENLKYNSLQWYHIPENHFPKSDDLLKSICREQAAEAFVYFKILNPNQLNDFRYGLMNYWINEIQMDGSNGDLKLNPDDLEELIAESKLFRENLEFYFDRNAPLFNYSSIQIRENLQYLELLAGKIIRNKYMPIINDREYNRDMLSILVDIYQKNLNNIAQKLEIPEADLNVKAKDAYNQIVLLNREK